MSNLQKGSRNYNRPEHILVFDTTALLSANKDDRVQVWRNNEQLGDCYVPGATYAEISSLSGNSRKPHEQKKAKEFLKFVREGCRYRIEPVEDNRRIPIDNKKDRQIIACAHRLANENTNCVVVLVTYDETLQGLVAQSHLPNFCTLTAHKLAVWFHEDYKRNRVPQEVFDTYRQMKNRRGGYIEAGNQTKLPSNRGSVEKPKIYPRKIEQVGGASPQGGNNPGHQKYDPQLPSSREGSPNSSRPSNRRPYAQQPSKPLFDLKNPLVIALSAIVIALLLFMFTNREEKAPAVSSQIPGIVSQTALAGTKKLEKTPNRLITEAETGIIQFQRTKEPSTLRQPLNTLQELKNKQGGELDKDGEQRLSRLKHKYAIEVLATSGQLPEAAILLREISPAFTDINAVNEWLVRHNL